MIELAVALTLFAAQDGDDGGSRAMAERTVAAAIEAHNAHDLDAFLATMSEDVVFLSLDGDVLVEGRDSVAEIWGRRFDERRDLVVEILHRTVIGNRVIDDELLCLNGPASPCVQLVAIYTVENDLIQTMHVIQPRGEN